LVLTAVGTLVGGPFGGAVGAIIGQQIDQNILFAPKPRQGPRLGDLSIQTSSYGAQIPKIFGTMRVAGTVIWATDLVEHRSTSGGKGRPRVTSYSYTASFAVALSARPAGTIRRIWADGKLLRGSAGDFKSQTGFRLHAGSEDQAADPLIVAAEGEDQAPAYRGLAYAVFEDMSLEDFGNRIPSLTFEILADPAPVPIGAIAETLSDGAATAGETPALGGYAATGDSVRGALEGLADVVPLSLVDDSVHLRLEATPGDPVAIEQSTLCQPVEISRRGQGAVPGEATVTYYDAARDYQTGLQRSVRNGGRAVDRRLLPAVLDAEGAKALADYRLASLCAGRTRAKAIVGWRSAAIRAGGHVRLEGEASLWRVDRWTLGAMTTTLDLMRVPGAPPPVLTASAGRATGEPDVTIGPTVLQLLDLPLGDGSETRPLLYVAAAGGNAGWRRAAMTASFDGGSSWQDMGGTAPPAVIGSALGGLPPGGSALFDSAATLDVELLHDGMVLESRTDDALVAGANLAVVGEELLQFGIVEPLGACRYRLSRLLRGRRGTEWAADGHMAGEAFILIARDNLVPIEVPAGANVQLLAHGAGDFPDPALATRVVGAEMLRPPAPVHFAATENGFGDLAISWTRRSRLGWLWSDGADTPLGEEAERYRLTIAGIGFERTIDTIQPTYLYTADARAADGSGPLVLTVVQAGSFASSRPATLIVD
jgi:hypothetical protein